MRLLPLLFGLALAASSCRTTEDRSAPKEIYQNKELTFCSAPWRCTNGTSTGVVKSQRGYANKDLCATDISRQMKAFNGCGNNGPIQTETIEYTTSTVAVLIYSCDQNPFKSYCAQLLLIIRLSQELGHNDVEGPSGRQLIEAFNDAWGMWEPILNPDLFFADDFLNRAKLARKEICRRRIQNPTADGVTSRHLELAGHLAQILRRHGTTVNELNCLATN